MACGRNVKLVPTFSLTALSAFHDDERKGGKTLSSVRMIDVHVPLTDSPAQLGPRPMTGARATH